jgi:hypothetical protein
LTEQTGRKLAWILFALWAAAYLWSIAAVPLTAPKGDGFPRGLNKITSFYGWQFLAGALAIGVLWAKRYLVPGSIARRLFWVPISIGGLLVAATLAVILIANYGKPVAVVPDNSRTTSPPAVTAPVDPGR